MKRLFFLGAVLTHCSAGGGTPTDGGGGTDGGSEATTTPPQSGDVVWTVDLPVPGAQTAVSMIPFGDDLYVSTAMQKTTNVVRVRGDGTIAWKWSDTTKTLISMRLDAAGVAYMVFSNELGGTNGNSNVFVALSQDTGVALWSRAIDFSLKYCVGYCTNAVNNTDSIVAFEAGDFVYYSGLSFNQNHFFGWLDKTAGTSGASSPFYTYLKVPYASINAQKDGSVLTRQGTVTQRESADLVTQHWTRTDAANEIRAYDDKFFIVYNTTTGALDVRNMSDGVVVPSQPLPVFASTNVGLAIDASDAFVYLSGVDTATSLEKLEKYDIATAAKAWSAAPGLARSVYAFSKTAAYLETRAMPLEIARHDLSNGGSVWRKPIPSANCDFSGGAKLLASDTRLLTGYCRQDGSYVLRIEKRLP